MRSFDLEQLKSDCLNPKGADGTLLIHNGVELHFKSLQELDNYIVDLTTRMCVERKNNVELIKPDYYEVQHDIPALIDIVAKIKKHVADFLESKEGGKNLTESRCNQIIECCKSIIEKAIEYRINIESMYERFLNGTIRISAVGAAGSGKSTFAKYYTGLANGIIPTHRKENEETTGTVCTLIHSDSNEVRHIASYYKRQDILDTLNYYLDVIKEKTGNRNNPKFCIVGGITKFEDFEKDFIENIGKLRTEDIPNYNNLPTDIQRGLSAFFSKTESIRGGYWYDFLDRDPCELKSNEEQQQHILMSHPTSLYLAVREVRTYVQFKKNGNIFKNFEIVDTKGIGSAAGAHSIREVCNAIDSSDAVFSIQSIQADTNFPFYNNGYLLNKYGGDKMFKNKHFMILNPYSGSDYNISLETLAKNGLIGNLAYCGSLYSHECHRNGCVRKEHDENLDCVLSCPVNEPCRKFVDLVVRNMLLRVSTMVCELDKDRICKRREDKKVLFSYINDLCELLNVEDYIYENREEVLSDKIRVLLKQVQEYVSGNNVEEESDSNKEYVDYLEQGDEITLYDIITNENAELTKREGKFTRGKNEEDEDFIKREIKKGLNDSYDTFAKHHRGTWSEREEVGYFIDDFADGLNKRIARALVKLNRQKELDPKVREEISNEIWRIMCLDEIFPETKGEWRGELIRKQNKVFEHLDDVFTPTLSDAQPPKPLFSPYLLLVRYFRDNNSGFELPEINEYGYTSDDKIYICKERLIDVSTELLYKLGIHKLIKEIYNSHSENCQRIALKQDLYNLVHVRTDAEECLDFYSIYSEKILTAEEQEKIKLANSWKIIKESINQILNIPLVKNID